MVNIPWGSEESRKFITNVGLITSYGKYGHNIMACEWTHHISYSPGLIALCIYKDDATAVNIKETKEFGINLASTNQSVITSLAGNYSGKDTDKISMLKELGFEFYKAKKIKPLMVKNAALNVECKLYKEIELGDHIMFVGEAVEVATAPVELLALHNGMYWKMSATLEKPSQQEKDKTSKIVEKYKKLKIIKKN